VSADADRIFVWLRRLLLGVYIFQVVRFAWLCDDAYITFRTVDNFVGGHGLTWNVAERVQVYTNPLFMLIFSLVYAFTREAFLSAIALQVVLSAGAAWLLGWKVARSAASGAFVLVVLAVSRSFVDYSTSGLENPLNHLLLAAFLWQILDRPRATFVHGLLAALLLTSRLDMALLVGPPLVYRVIQARSWRAVLGAALGFAPFLLWEGFALVYYGSPVPNTAYAKLSTGIPDRALIPQGRHYYHALLKFDRPGFVVLAAGLAAGLVLWRRFGAWALALSLYLVYVIEIGGDFMAGRFFTAPLCIAVGLLAQLELPRRWSAAWLLPALGAIGLAYQTDRSPVHPGAARAVARAHFADCIVEGKISDERFCWSESSSLASDTPWSELPVGYWRKTGEELHKSAAAHPGRRLVTERLNIGMIGYYAGPDVHVVDPYALADPLLARLPIAAGEPWGIGHFARVVPKGYLKAVVEGPDALEDKGIAALYAEVWLVTRGPIFAPARWGAIWRLATGADDELYDHEKARRR